ncbi:MAG: SpoIIE family protein phosphatase [Ignavibacteriae bacterium]|nr:SpoIIE family protein phosphatase [Ignavibacteriota bacterium]
MFEKFLTKYRKKLLLPVTMVLLAIGVVNIYFVFNITTRTNDECIWAPVKIEDGKGKIIFKNVKINGVAWEAGIRDGDELLELEGKKLRNIYHASYIADSKKSGDSLSYTYSRDGKMYKTKVRVKKLLMFSDLAMVLLGLIWLGVGFIVTSSKPFGSVQNLFYRIGAFLLLFSTFALFKGNSNVNPILQVPILLLIVDILWITGVIFATYSIVHFFWVFPREMEIMKKKFTKKILTITPIVLCIVALMYRIIFIYYRSALGKGISPYNEIFSSAIRLLFGISLFIGLVSLFRNYFRLDKIERKSIFSILFFYTLGMIAVISVSIFSNLSAGAFFNSPEYFLPIFLISFIPVGFAYSIFKYSLMDVSDVLKNTIWYGTATFSLAGAYFLLMYILGQTISEAITEDYQGVVAAGVFIMFAFVFQSTKDRFQNVITKSFYPEQFAYQQVLVKFSNDVSTIVGLDNILDSVQSTFVDGLKVEKFGIALKNNNDNAFLLKRESGFVNKKLVFENENNILQTKVKEKLKLNLPIAFDNIEIKEICPNKIDHLEVDKIYTIIPLVIKQKVIGLVLFGLKHSGAQFAGKDIDLLIAAANQTAVSIENARLYEAEAEKIKMERDLDVARQIQEGLLPVEVPKIKSLDTAGIMIPALQVGGDYYDLIKVSETQMYIVVGDVSGKGLSASFYMSKLQTMIRLFCTGEKSPKEVLTEVNKQLDGNIEKQWFITLTIALVDINKNTIIISRAGHTPTLKYSKGAIEYLQPNGMGVGLDFSHLFKSTLKEVELQLEKDDIYMFSSDGVNEAMNNSNEMYGDERLEEIFKNTSNSNSKKIVDSTIMSLKEFRGSKEPNDDITIVVLKIV